MGELVIVALKYGIKGIPFIAGEWGPAAAFIAFFTFVPLGHLILGVLLIVLAMFAPKLPGDDTTHMVHVGTPPHNIALRGNARTALIAGGLAIIAFAGFESVALQSVGAY